MDISQQVKQFTENAYYAYQENRLTDYLAEHFTLNTLYAASEEDWALFMQLCYNHLPSDEIVLQRHIGRLDTYHLMGLVVDVKHSYNAQVIKTLIGLLRLPHLRRDNVLIFDHVETFPLHALLPYDDYLLDIAIDSRTSTVKLTLNPKRVVFYTYDEALLEDIEAILFIDINKVDLTLEDEMLKHSITYLQHKLANKVRTNALYQHLSAKYFNKALPPRPCKYKLDSPLNQPLVESIDYLLSNTHLTPVRNDDYLLLNNSWSICVKGKSSAKNPRQYYNNEQLPLL